MSNTIEKNKKVNPASSNVRKLIVEELHKPARINFPRRHTRVWDINETLQMDLVEMTNYGKVNRGFKYFISIIDVFSKYAWAFPLKNKSADEVYKVLKKFFQPSTPHLNPSKVRNVQTDQGREFFNSKCAALFKSLGINHYCTYTTLKASIVERWNRTIKTKIWKHFSQVGNYKWVDVVQRLVDEYNRSEHRVIKLAPADVSNSNKDQVLRNIESFVHNSSSQRSVRPDQFKIGDRVRISKHKYAFSKGYTPSWSAEIFKIIKKNNSSPNTYILQDENGNVINGCFYPQELQITKFPDTFLVEKILKKDLRRKLYLVKWFEISSRKE